jgi:hypothetical protein
VAQENTQEGRKDLQIEVDAPELSDFFDRGEF